MLYCHPDFKCDANIAGFEIVFQGSSFEIWLIWGTDAIQFSVHPHGSGCRAAIDSTAHFLSKLVKFDTL